MKIDILGTEYDLQVLTEEQDPALKNCDGYCDYSMKKLVVIDYKPKGADDIQNATYYLKQIKRHEIIHAFFHESGLGADWEHKQFGQDETTIDWMARQFPKLMQAFKAADAL